MSGAAQRGRIANVRKIAMLHANAMGDIVLMLPVLGASTR